MLHDNQKISLNGKEYTVEKYLGKGKSAYSYLIKNADRNYVLKAIHHEPCAYYHFEDKFLAEISAYNKLKESNILIPELIDYNQKEERLIKTYIEGSTLAELIAQDAITDDLISELFRIANSAFQQGINIDYFPTNFVIKGGQIYYIDYEFNPYSPDWNFENWGIWYYANTQGMKHFLETGDHSQINSNNSGIPHKDPFKTKVERWKKISPYFPQ